MVFRYHHFEPFRYRCGVVTDNFTRIGSLVYMGNSCPTLMYIAFLRDPVERVISLYYFVKNKSENIWHHELVDNNWSLEEWLEHSKSLRLFDGQLRQLLLGTHDEVQHNKQLNQGHLEEGKKRLQALEYIGLTETFEEDANYLYGKLGFLRFYHEPVVNRTQRDIAITQREREIIAEHNKFDIELYQYAKELRRKSAAKHRVAYAFHRRKARILRYAYSTSKDTALKIQSRLHK